MTSAYTVLQDAYQAAMVRIASPVAVVTFTASGRSNGLTCTAICSASTQPPVLAVCINPKLAACDGMIAAGAFTVNFLADEQTENARQFSHGASSHDPFAQNAWEINDEDAPVLIGAANVFECRLEKTEMIGGHCVFFGAVEAVQGSDVPELLYRDGFFRRLAIQ